MSSQFTKDIHVAIVGGGVCGLTCAIALMRRGVPVQIYEAATHFGEVGAGLGIGTNATRILKDLDLLDDVLKKSEQGDKPTQQGDKPIQQEDEPVRSGWFHFLSGFEDHESILDYVTAPGEGSIGTHRAVFLDALVQHIDLKVVHFNKRCTAVVQAEIEPFKLAIKFADGTEASADVVLGADGLKSAVRGAVTGADPFASVSFSNTECYRALVPIEAVRAAGVTRDYAARPICYLGNDKHLIVYSIMGGAVINIVAFAADHNAAIGEHNLPRDTPTVVPVDPAQLLQEYQAFGSEVTSLLACAKQPTKWVINVVSPPLQSYVKGKIALLGDAAHAMLPHLGAGAGQGIEDVEVLSKLLSHPQTTLRNVEEVLTVYDEIRRPRAQKIWEGSVESGRVANGRGPSGNSPEGMRKDLTGMWDYVWRHDLKADLERAVHILEERGVFNMTVTASL